MKPRHPLRPDRTSEKRSEPGDETRRSFLAGALSLGGLSGLPSLGQVTPSTRHVFDVRSYGARGDGVTNDSAAFHAAIRAMPSRGGVLFCPYGVYLLASTVTLDKQLMLVGEGYSLDVIGGATVLLKKGSLSGPALRTTSANCTLQDFQLDGQSGNEGDGIAIEALSCSVSRVTVTRQGNDGIRIGNAGPSGNMNLWRLDQVALVRNRRDGLHLEHPKGRNAGAGTATGVMCQANGRFGFYAGDGALNNVFVGCTAEENGSDGVRLARSGSMSANSRFFGCDLDESNGGKAIHIERGVADTHLISCNVSASSVVDDGRRTVLSSSTEFQFEDIRVRRVLPRGSAITAGDFALSNWGEGAAVVATRGSDLAFSVSVRAGRSPANNPILTLTFKDGPWTTPPVAIATLQAGDAPNLVFANVTVHFPSAATMALTLRSTPVAGTVYSFHAVVVGS